MYGVFYVCFRIFMFLYAIMRLSKYLTISLFFRDKFIAYNNIKLLYFSGRKVGAVSTTMLVRSRQTRTGTKVQRPMKWDSESKRNELFFLDYTQNFFFWVVDVWGRNGSWGELHNFRNKGKEFMSLTRKNYYKTLCLWIELWSSLSTVVELFFYGFDSFNQIYNKI